MHNFDSGSHKTLFLQLFLSTNSLRIDVSMTRDAMAQIFQYTIFIRHQNASITLENIFRENAS